MAQNSQSSEATAEPLMSMSEVLGMKAPEPVSTAIEEQAQEEEVQSLLKPKHPYDRWKLDPSAENLFATVKYLQPTISAAVQTMGGGNNPQIAAKARVVAAKAVQTYDPSYGASLPTWVTQQLRQLNRTIRDSRSPLHTPDGVQLDAYNIYRATKELEDDLNREPTMQEIADKAHLSIKRIRDVRKKMRAVGTEAPMDPEQQTGNEQAGEETDYSQEALNYVYNDCDMLEKKVLEYSTGFNGEPPLPTSEIKKKLKLSDVQLSRIRTRLGFRVRDVIENLSTVQQ